MPFLGDLERFAATTLYPWRFADRRARGRRGGRPRRPRRPARLARRRPAPPRPDGRSWSRPSSSSWRPPPGTSARRSSSAPSSRSHRRRRSSPSPVPSAGAEPATAPAGSERRRRPCPRRRPPLPTPTATPVVRSGTFVGADDFHFGRGRATLTEAPDGSHTLRFDDFSVRNGPDLFVYLSPDPEGYAEGAIELGRLRATDGSFNTPIPAGTDVGTARSVVIWCKEFAVLFAVAPLDG